MLGEASISHRRDLGSNFGKRISLNSILMLRDVDVALKIDVGGRT